MCCTNATSIIADSLTLKYQSERDLHRNNLNLARNNYYLSRLKGLTCGAMWRELRKLGLLEDSGTRALAVDVAQLNKAFVAVSEATAQHLHLPRAVKLGMQTDFCFSEISTADVVKAFSALGTDVVGADRLSRNMLTSLLPLIQDHVKHFYNASLRDWGNYLKELWVFK